MSRPLSIAARGNLDLLALGALVCRLDPRASPFRKATQFDIHLSGAEYNVAANLADCFGMRTGIVTAMVGYTIDELVSERVRAAGVQSVYRYSTHDGVTGPNIATVYSDRSLAGRDINESLYLGWAHGALVATYPGDTTMATLADVEHLVRGESARIQR